MKSVGLYREVAMEVGGGSIHLGKVISHIGTNGVDIWGGDLGDFGCNGKET